MTDPQRLPEDQDSGAPPEHAPPRKPRKRTKRTVPAEEVSPRRFTSAQRLLILDSWQRSGLPAGDFAPLVGVSTAALYKWKRRFETHGPCGLEENPRGAPPGSRLPEPTKRAILLMKELKPDWGQDRIYYELMRTQGLQASPGAVAKVLEEAGYEVVSEPTREHKTPDRRFERAKPNQLWQTDLFTFVLKRQNRRVHLVGFMDDHSRFVVGYGLHASATGALVIEAFEAAIANHGAPEEVLTDNGPQYHNWRGRSAFNKLCDRRGIKQIVARPRHPQTLGKIERFWKTLWQECVETAIFRDLTEARTRIGLFIDHYNFHRTHQGIDGHVPADRFYRAAPEVKDALRARVAKNAHELAKDGLPRKDFYLTGRVGDVGISLHAEGEQVVLTQEDGTREEVHLGATGRRGEEKTEQVFPVPLSVEAAPAPRPGSADEAELPPPGTSALDGALAAMRAALSEPPLEEGASDGDDGDGEEEVE